MKYKLICIDLDGTLLNSEKKISEYNLKIISQVKAKGIKIAIVTGRSYQRAYRYAEQIGMDSPLICFNGGMIIDPDTCEIMHQTSIDREYAKRVIKVWSETGCPAFVSRATVEKPAIYALNLGTHPEVLKYKEGFDDALVTCEDLAEKLWFDPIQMMTMGQLEKMECCKDFEALFTDDRVLWLQDSNGSDVPFLILYSREAKKSFGLKWLSEYYDIRQEQVLAIGDYLNDLDMLEWAGLGVAMGNAHPDAKKVANIITADADEDGVGKILEKLFL